jgi:hypothetical protein
MDLFANKIESLTALKDYVIVCDMNFDGRKLSSGIVLLGDDGKSSGIRPRWAKVYAVGPQQRDVKAGEWVLVEHGRWTRGVNVEVAGEQITIRRVDPSNIMFVSDTDPGADDNFSTAVQIQEKSLY